MAIEIEAPKKRPDGFSIFLAGSIDMGSAKDWQSEVVDALKDYDVILTNPRRTDWDSSWEQSADDPKFREQVEWEQDNLDAADFRIFNFEKDSKSPITFEEMGANLDRPGVICCPDGFYRKGNVDIVAERAGMPVYESFDSMMEYIKDMLDEMGLRKSEAKTASTLTPTVGLPTFEQFIENAGGLEEFLRGMSDAENYYEEAASWSDSDAFAAMSEEEQKEHILDYTRERLEEAYYDFSSEYAGQTFPMPLYREVTLENGIESLKLQGIGVCWTWDIKSAEAHWGTYDHQIFLLKALADEDAIDWEQTLLRNLDPATGEAEREITLREGAQITLVGYQEVQSGHRFKHTDDGDWTPLSQKTVTASAKEMGLRKSEAKTAASSPASEEGRSVGFHAASEAATALTETAKEAASSGVIAGTSTEDSETFTDVKPAKEAVTDTPAFKTWFNGSKIIDEQGQPLKVYHGTSSNFDTFKAGPRSRAGHGMQIPGMYFTPFPGVAAAYARSKAVYDGQWDSKGEVFGEVVMPCYLKIVNPKTYHNTEDFIGADKSSLQAEGFDGAIRYAEDEPHPLTEIVAFYPNQIKSAIGNNGEFSSANHKITASWLSPSEQQDERLTAFLHDLWDHTTPNPLNDNEVIWNSTVGIDAKQALGRIHVSSIRSLAEGQGQASAALEFLKELAAKHQVELDVVPVPFGGRRLNQSQLRLWYVRHGFKPVPASGHYVYSPADVASEETKRRDGMTAAPVEEPPTEASVTASAKTAKSIGPVYHGTTYDFDAFKRSKGLRSGFLGSVLETDVFAYFFTQSRYQAVAYAKNRQLHTKEPGRVITAYLTINNLLDFTSQDWVNLKIANPPLPLHKVEQGSDPDEVYEDHADDLDQAHGLLDYLVNYLLADDMTSEEWGELGIDDGHTYGEKSREPALEEGFTAYFLFDNKKVTDALRYLGFDGAKVPEGEDPEFGGESYCVFSSDQVRIVSNKEIAPAKAASATAAPESNAGLAQALDALRPQLADVAQKLYDEWDQDEDGIDVEYGAGGICDAIARCQGDLINEQLGEQFPDLEISDGGGDDHAWLVVTAAGASFGVDIYPGVYETGGGYSWTKRKGVTISAPDVEVFRLPYQESESGFAHEASTTHVVSDGLVDWRKPVEGQTTSLRALKQGDRLAAELIVARLGEIGCMDIPWDTEVPILWGEIEKYWHENDHIKPDTAQHIDEISRLMKEGKKFAPALLSDATWLDGNHRVKAARRLGLSKVPYINLHHFTSPPKTDTRKGKEISADDLLRELQEEKVAAATTPVPDFSSYVDWSYEGREHGEQHFVNSLLVRPYSLALDDYDLDEAKRKFKRRTAPLRGLHFPLEVFRAVRLPGGIDGLNTDNIGVCWSYSEYAAKPIMARGKGTDWLLHGRIESADSIDWNMTVSWALEKPAEKEVRLRHGATVQLLEYREMNDSSKWKKAKQRLVTAAAVASPVSPVTESPAFKAWFGDSVVKDAQGNPLVVYRGQHGESDEEFHSREPSLSFGDAETASLYAEHPNHRGDKPERPRVYACYLRMERPIMNSPEDPFLDFAVLANALGDEEAGKFARKHAADVTETNNWEEQFAEEWTSVDSLLEAQPEAVRELYMLAFPLLADHELVAALKAKGFDGAVHAGSGANLDQCEYKVFDRSQVKSAIGNNGEFSLENHSIIASSSHGAKENAPTVAQLVQAASEAVGSENTVSGNCGVYALALATWLKRNGHPATIGIWSDAHRNTSPQAVLTDKHCSIEHVCVECYGKKWDGSGETDTARVEEILWQENGADTRISYFGGYRLSDSQLSMAIRLKTEHTCLAGELLLEIEGFPKKDGKKASTISEQRRASKIPIDQETNMEPKTAYISPKEAELTVTIDLGTRPKATVALDLGIPNFTVFSLTFPVDEIKPTDLVPYVEDAMEALLDEVAAFMLSLRYPEEQVVSIMDLARECFHRITFKDASDDGMGNKDEALRMYEGHFELSPEFVDETLIHVVTGATVKRNPPVRHLELTRFRPVNKANSPARIIQLYRNRTLRTMPRPHYVLVYDLYGHGIGALPLAKNWESRVLKRSR